MENDDDGPTLLRRNPLPEKGHDLPDADWTCPKGHPEQFKPECYRCRDWIRFGSCAKHGPLRREECHRCRAECATSMVVMLGSHGGVSLVEELRLGEFLIIRWKHTGDPIVELQFVGYGKVHVRCPFLERKDGVPILPLRDICTLCPRRPIDPPIYASAGISAADIDQTFLESVLLEDSLRHYWIHQVAAILPSEQFLAENCQAELMDAARHIISGDVTNEDLMGEIGTWMRPHIRFRAKPILCVRPMGMPPPKKIGILQRGKFQMEKVAVQVFKRIYHVRERRMVDTKRSLAMIQACYALATSPEDCIFCVLPVELLLLIMQATLKAASLRPDILLSDDETLGYSDPTYASEAWDAFDEKKHTTASWTRGMTLEQARETVTDPEYPRKRTIAYAGTADEISVDGSSGCIHPRLPDEYARQHKRRRRQTVGGSEATHEGGLSPLPGGGTVDR